MDLNKKQIEFFTLLLAIMLGAAILILLVDFGIKAAILEESTRLRLKIEEWQNGRGNEETNPSGIPLDSDFIADASVDILVDQPARMETENVSNGVAQSSTNSGGRRRPKSKGQTDNSGIQDGNESVG